jgi:hypothetical protein
MSDPVTNADTEDVLTQVRRLVLQGTPREAADSRLVLTPAQRVAERPDRAEPPRADHAGEPLPEPAAAPRALAPEAPLQLADPLAPASARAEGARGIEAALRTGAWEPDGSEALDRMLGRALDEALDASALPVLRRRAQRAAQAEPAPSPARPAGPSPAPQPSPARLAAEEALPALDEGVLRALVVDVVRAELQGELGERITRNLRRLVRREVFRALESRDEP